MNNAQKTNYTTIESLFYSNATTYYRFTALGSSADLALTAKKTQQENDDDDDDVVAILDNASRTDKTIKH